jgi:DNA-binding transcriptional ArsR family regulator
MSTLFEILGEPNRRRIVEILRDNTLAVGEIVDALGMSQPAVSKHLRVLKDAGAVGVQQDGQRRLYYLRAEPLMELDAWLRPYRALWEEKFDRLDALLKEMQTNENDERLKQEAEQEATDDEDAAA